MPVLAFKLSTLEYNLYVTDPVSMHAAVYFLQQKNPIIQIKPYTINRPDR